jgi:hypothetical protein
LPLKQGAGLKHLIKQPSSDCLGGFAYWRVLNGYPEIISRS